MEERKLTSNVTAGEVVIVRRPHTQQAKLYWYGDVDEAFDAWKNEGTFMQYENAENYINELGIESGEESEEVKKRLVDAGINLDSPFVEFASSPSRDMELYPWDGNKVKFLSAIIEDDMHAAGIFIAQDGETYGDFVERILAGTRGHNEPSQTSIMATLGIDPEDIEMEISSEKGSLTVKDYNVAQKYTQTQFGKSIKEQFTAENERTNTQKQTIQEGERNMEQTEKEPYEKLDRSIENLSREEACALLGERLIKEVESLNCDYTNRVTDGTEWHGFTEFMSSLELGNNNYHINAYYYQENEDVENTEDLGSLKWEVQKFELIPWNLSAGEALSLQGFTDMVIDYGDEGTQVAGWKDLTEQQQEILALAYYQFRQEEERELESDEYDSRAWEVLEVEDGWNRGAEELKEWVAREIDSGVGIREGLDEIELQIVEDQARSVKERQRTIEVEEGDYRASSYAAIESYYQEFIEAGFNRDVTIKQNPAIANVQSEISSEKGSLTVKDYNVAQKYTQTQFGKSIKEQFTAENERTNTQKQTIQEGERNMEQTEKKTPYYQQQIEKLHEAVKTGTAPFFLKEAVVGENNEVKNPGNYIEDNDKIILTPRPAVRTVTGNLLKGVNQLSAQIELDNMGSKAQTVLSFEDAKAAGTYIKKGSKSILLTGYDKDNERSKVYHVFSAGSVANTEAIKEQLYKNSELNKAKPWSKAIVCTDSNPEKYLGAYLAASASGSVLETDRKTVETFQKNFQNLIEKSISEKKHTAVFDVVRSAQMVKSEILKKNFSTWEKSQEQHKQGQQKGQQKKSPQSDMEMVF